MKKSFHLWESYIPEKITVNISQKSKDNFAKLIGKGIYKTAKKLKITPSRIYDYFFTQSSQIPLDRLLSISRFFNINLEELEKEIISYKHKLVPIKNSVFNPLLPLKISPYFTSVVSHLFFDGSLPNDGRGTYYNQKRKIPMDLFTKKLQEVFGDIQYSIVKDHKGILKCRFPRIAGEICKKIYEVKTFHGNVARIPRAIFNLNKDHRSAFFISAIFDEGSIAYDGHIIFGVNNRLLCEDLKKMGQGLGLDISDVKEKKSPSFYYFHIKTIREFHKLAKEFSNKYPLISLDYKMGRLEKSLEIKSQKFEYTKDFSDKRKNLIFEELSKEKKTINQLALKLLIPPRTIRRYMYDLIRKDKITRIKKGIEYYYSKS
ncbi:MAG: hypothetical protein KKF50_02880 [Nanoarchaeota archaeon]|nr:hypothetical protein [Nanoarchaeota archaeon]